MQSASRFRQRGLSLSGLMLWGFVIALIAMLTMKVLPEIIEYYTIVKISKAVVKDPASKTWSVSEIKNSFSRRAEVDNVKRLKADDLDILKDGDKLEISFAYTAQIPLFDHVSLTIDFEGGAR